MPKAHLVTSESPLVAGQSCKSHCGTEILRAKFLFVFDSAEMNETLDFLSTSKLCRKCREMLGEGIYVYACIEGRGIEHV